MSFSTEKIQLPTQAGQYGFGDFGLRYLTASGTSTAGDSYFAIFANEAAVISATSTRAGTTSIVGMPIPAGSTIYGCFTDVTCTSGKITCYLKEPA